MNIQLDIPFCRALYLYATYTGGTVTGESTDFQREFDFHIEDKKDVRDTDIAPVIGLWSVAAPKGIH